MSLLSTRGDRQHSIRVFIGSSSNSIDIARQIKKRLAALVPQAAFKVWDEAFKPGQMLLDKIVGLVKTCDFGIFVFAADDVLHIRKQQVLTGDPQKSSQQPVFSVRDNVLFEAGVFMGGLGHERTFLVVPAFITGLRTPSDLKGLLTANYGISDAHSEGERFSLDIDTAAKQIAEAIVDLGPCLRTNHDELIALQESMTKCEFEGRKRSGGERQKLVLSDLVSFAANKRKREWHPRVDPMQLMKPIKDKWGNVAADDAYWWLVVLGVFQFKDIDNFTTGSWVWKQSIPCVHLSERGAALLNMFRRSDH